MSDRVLIEPEDFPRCLEAEDVIFIDTREGSKKSSPLSRNSSVVLAYAVPSELSSTSSRWIAVWDNPAAVISCSRCLATRGPRSCMAASTTMDSAALIPGVSGGVYSGL